MYEFDFLLIFIKIFLGFFLQSNIEKTKAFETILQAIDIVLKKNNLMKCKGCKDKLCGVARDYLNSGTIYMDGEIEYFFPNNCLSLIPIQNAKKQKNFCKYCVSMKSTLSHARKKKK